MGNKATQVKASAPMELCSDHSLHCNKVVEIPGGCSAFIECHEQVEFVWVTTDSDESHEWEGVCMLKLLGVEGTIMRCADAKQQEFSLSIYSGLSFAKFSCETLDLS